MEDKSRIKEKFSKRRVLSLPYFSILIVFIITIGATYLFYKNATGKDEIRFENEVTKINSRLEIQLSKKVVALRATKYIKESNEELKLRNNFSFIETNDVGFLEYVRTDTDIPNNLNNIKYDNLKFRDPKKANVVLESLEKESILKSIENDELTISKVDLKEKVGNSLTGYMLLFPVFEKESENKTETAKFSGFVFYTFTKEEFLKLVYEKNSLEEVGLQLSLKDKELWKNDIASAGLNNEKTFETIGNAWKAKYDALPKFFESSSVNLTVLIPIGGLLIGILIFGFLRFEAQTKLELADIAEELNKAEGQKASLLKSEQKARKTAETSSRLKDEFISLVSHEIRTPLNSIAGWTNILRSDQITKETKQKAIKTINKNIKTQAEIIDELLLFSTLTTKEQVLKAELIKISSVVDNAVEEVIPKAKQKQIHLVKENNLNSEEIYCDKSKMNRAIKNLLQNAIKFTPHGGEVKILVNKTENGINLKIQDSGKGIKKEFLPHIFDTFRQADSSTTRKYGGLGLGLAITKQIINLHGGEINVKSDGEDKGTEFEIKLPTNN